MPDLRDDLDRLAGHAGKPTSFDDLASARRRRERRRRAEGLVVGLAVVVAMAVFLASTFRSEPASVPGASETPQDGLVVPTAPYLWPENWADSTGADALAATTAAVAAGDPDVAWRLDPEQVVRRFTAEVLGWSDLSVHGQQSGAGTEWWEVSPNCPGGGCDPSMLETIRVDRIPESGAWVVTSVEASELRTGFEHGFDAGELAPRLEAGDLVSFQLDVPEGRRAHIGVVTFDGCSSGTAVDQGLASGRYTLPVPGQNDPACTGDIVGYVFAFTTDDTTVPVEDPLLEPGAVEAPGLTIIPIVVAAPSGGVTSPDPTVDPVAWTTYADPLGWTIDVPTSWVTVPIDGSDGELAYEGAVFGSAEPQPEPLTPTAFNLPPGEVSIEVFNVSGRNYECIHNDSAFPLSFEDFVLPPEADDAGDLWGQFVANGCLFTLASASAADATPQQTEILRRMVESIRFETDPSLPPQSPSIVTPSGGVDLTTCLAAPATDITIVGKDVSLSGCTNWAANHPLSFRLDVRDAIPMRLALWHAARCDENGCQGDPIWRSNLIQTGTLTFYEDGLDPGQYVLLDPVHPVSARLEISVGAY